MIIVEDGTGEPGANAYINISYVSNYLLGEQLDAWGALSEPEQESAIVRATRYVNSAFAWLGTRKTLDQGLLWPREGVELDGFEITGVPKEVKEATAECVALVMQDAELFSEEADRQIASEKVDVVAVSYFQQSETSGKTATKFDVLNKLLRGLYKENTGGGGVGSAKVLRT
ncbi:MAG: hypothetical protein LBQ88_03605 [Treponema sp.]|jgi:hypothetical protein|nr:hypothetical protein [Treponema sp.]